MKRVYCILLVLLLMTAPLSGCTGGRDETGETDGRLSVVSTLFPQYDFARRIVGEKAEVTLLLPPGTESHTYEPTPSDIVSVSKADLFLYTGAVMEPWADKILQSLGSNAPRTADVSEGIEAAAEHQDHGEAAHEEEAHTVDPHIWLDPVNAQVIVDNILAGLTEASPEDVAFFEENAEGLKSDLSQLDEDIRAVVAGAKYKTLAFGGRFAFTYFCNRYGLSHVSAFDSCSAESEPSVSAVARVISTIEEQGLPAVYYEEFTEPRVANSIAGQTGAKPLLLHTVHNVTREEREAGVTYLDIMRENLKNLKIGLNGE